MDVPTLSSTSLTDIGLKRKTNQDAILVLQHLGIFCVADGMGGAQGGAEASQYTVGQIENSFLKPETSPSDLSLRDKVTQVKQAVNASSRWIKQRADELGNLGSGTTVVALVFDHACQRDAVSLHAGDSRVYRLRDKKLQQCTRDHSVTQELGFKTERSLPSMFRGVVTRAVGLKTKVRMEETYIDVQANDLFLLCSDGLTKMVNDKNLYSYLKEHTATNLELLAEKLVHSAKEAGGDDNISVLLIRVNKWHGDPTKNSVSNSLDEADSSETEQLTPVTNISLTAMQEPLDVRTSKDDVKGTCNERKDSQKPRYRYAALLMTASLILLMAGIVRVGLLKKRDAARVPVQIVGTIGSANTFTLERWLPSRGTWEAFSDGMFFSPGTHRIRVQREGYPPIVITRTVRSIEQPFGLSLADFDQRLALAEESLEQILRTTDTSIVRAWIPTWYWAVESEVEEAADRYQLFNSAFKTALPQLENPSRIDEPPWLKEDRTKRAEAYVAQLYRYKKDLIDYLREFYINQIRQSWMFRNDIEELLGSLWVFSVPSSNREVRNTTELVTLLEKNRRRIQQLKRWLDNIEVGPIPIDQLQKCPFNVDFEKDASHAFRLVKQRVDSLSQAIQAWQTRPELSLDSKKKLLEIRNAFDTYTSDTSPSNPYDLTSLLVEINAFFTETNNQAR